MSHHDDLLKQGAREAPEPETAEQKSRKLGLKTAGGAVAGGGGVAAAKIGVLGGFGKFFLWLAAWNIFRASWFYGGWIALAVMVALVIFFVEMRRRHD